METTSAPSYQLVPATWADSDFLNDLNTMCMRPLVERWGRWDSSQFLSRFEPHNFRIIRSELRQAGMLSAIDKKDTVYLAEIQLLPEFQGRGIGTHLINRIKDHSRKREVPVLLRVLKNNPALTLYQRLGFVIQEDAHSHWRMHWNPASSS